MNDADANPEPVDGAGQKGAENVHANDAPDDPLPPEEIGPVLGLTPQQTEELRKRYLLKRFLINARGFWSRRGDGLAWPFSIGLLAMIGVNVGFQYGINVWNRGIFDAIEERDASTVYFLASIFPPLVLGSVFIVTSQVYVRMRIQRRGRLWLTKVLVSRWIANGRYYQLNLIDGDHQNPEARLSEDLRIATEAPVDFVAGVIAA